MNAAKITTKQRMERFFKFFPFMLLVLHVKRNHFLLVFWILLFGFTTGFIGEKYGVVHQFLYPEYLESNNFLSFAFIGFALGGFIMGFNLYTYILHGFRFPFIATLDRPFIKFSINNFALPFIYILTFLYCTIHYQYTEELLQIKDILINLFGFFSGLFVYWAVTWLYFKYTNKSAAQIAAKKNPVHSGIHKDRTWLGESKTKKWSVETYLTFPFSIRLARDSAHYDKSTLAKVFSQNHYNSSIYELLLIISFLAIGTFSESELFAIPAGASGILFFTLIMMLFSAIFSWIKGWTLSVIVILFLLANYWSTSAELLQIPNHAYGLNYEAAPADYSKQNLLSLSTDEDQLRDKINTMHILENWKEKVSSRYTGGEKPKLLIVNCSGGGSRSALWTMNNLVALNEASDGQFMDQTFMITGSSGGMIGASYTRELYLRDQHQELDMHNPEFINDMGKDLLNPILFSMATNDFFLRFRTFEEDGKTYKKDRAYAFERKVHKNTRGYLKKKLSDYREAEFKAQIPLVLMAPTITNDGRRLLISSQPISYLSTSGTSALAEDIEFRKLFKEQGADDISYMSALRMNATFPYILPMVTLPSDPPIRIMDAGLRDNYGLKTTFEFLYQFSDWIEENTSGVLLVQTRDLPEDFEKEHKEPNLVNAFAAPLGSVYDNFINTQRYSNDQFFRYLNESVENIEIVTLYLESENESQVSLSWHLTQAEKKSVEQAMESADNQSKRGWIVDRIQK